MNKHILYYPEDGGGGEENNVSEENKSKATSKSKKSGTSADKVTENADLENQIKLLSDKLAKKERTEENAKFLDETSRELDVLKNKLPSINKEGNTPFWKSWLTDLDSFLNQ
jgi:hypothetical protein